MIDGLKRVAIAVAAAAILAAAAWYGWRWYDRSRDIQTTDNAYIRGEITGLAPRVSGYAVEVMVDDNMPVEAKQVLVRIDPRDFRVTAERAQAALDQADAMLAQVKAQRELEHSKIAVAEAALRSAKAQAENAEIVLARATDLLQKNAGTKASVDTATAADIAARSSVDQAVANLAYERQQLAVIDANEVSAKAQIESARAALLSAKFALEDSEVWAPIAGIVTNRKTRVGEYVTAGTRMLSIVPVTNLWVEANYRETQIERMKAGDPARIDIDTYPGQPLCGYVESISPASGSEFALIPPDNATGNFTKIVRRFTVRLRFNARETKAALARPGMSTEARVAVSSEDGLGAPERARRVGCDFDPAQDITARVLTTLPEHPGLGRARPQGNDGVRLP